MRAGVLLLHVEPQAADVGTRGRFGANVAVQGGVHALATMRGVDVDALDPPPVRATPVAPLVGEHQRAGGLAIALGDEVSATPRFVEHTLHAAQHGIGIEPRVFGFQRHGAGPRGQPAGFVAARRANEDVVAHAMIVA